MTNRRLPPHSAQQLGVTGIGWLKIEKLGLGRHRSKNFSKSSRPAASRARIGQRCGFSVIARNFSLDICLGLGILLHGDGGRVLPENMICDPGEHFSIYKYSGCNVTHSQKKVGQSCKYPICYSRHQRYSTHRSRPGGLRRQPPPPSLQPRAKFPEVCTRPDGASPTCGFTNFHQTVLVFSLALSYSAALHGSSRSCTLLAPVVQMVKHGERPTGSRPPAAAHRSSRELAGSSTGAMSSPAGESTVVVVGQKS